tara:strand:+ start:311 stop:634 length:324 start_codon:yes stop_codon:yes gene_type:complete
MKSRTLDKEDHHEYEVGDLVRVSEDTATPTGLRGCVDIDSALDDNCYQIGLVIGKSSAWYDAYYDVIDNDLEGTRYWDSITNYAPYRVQLLTGKVYWVSHVNMRLLS